MLLFFTDTVAAAAIVVDAATAAVGSARSDICLEHFYWLALQFFFSIYLIQFILFLIFHTEICVFCIVWLDNALRSVVHLIFFCFCCCRRRQIFFRLAGKILQIKDENLCKSMWTKWWHWFTEGLPLKVATKQTNFRLYFTFYCCARCCWSDNEVVMFCIFFLQPSQAYWLASFTIT